MDDISSNVHRDIIRKNIGILHEKMKATEVFIDEQNASKDIDGTWRQTLTRLNISTNSFDALWTTKSQYQLMHHLECLPLDTLECQEAEASICQWLQYRKIGKIKSQRMQLRT